MHNKFKSFAIALGSAVTLSLSALSPVFAQEQTPSVSMYRLYNKNTGEHFYTADTNERKTLLYCGWKDEGIGWFAPTHSNTPVYRLYNPNAGDHHYTMYSNERQTLINLGWKDEGIGWYSDDAKTEAIFRQYNPNAKVGTHNYSTNIDEHYGLVRMGWKDEGIGWFALQEGVPISPENPELQLPPNEKGHYEKVWIEGKTEKVPIYEDKVVWICAKCHHRFSEGEKQSEHAYQHYIKGEPCNTFSTHEKVVVGYNTVETPGHYEWKWVAD